MLHLLLPLEQDCLALSLDQKLLYCFPAIHSSLLKRFEDARMKLVIHFSMKSLFILFVSSTMRTVLLFACTFFDVAIEALFIKNAS